MKTNFRKNDSVLILKDYAIANPTVWDKIKDYPIGVVINNSRLYYSDVRVHTPNGNVLILYVSKRLLRYINKKQIALKATLLM